MPLLIKKICRYSPQQIADAGSFYVKKETHISFDC